MDNKKKGLILISNVHKALEHEWFCDFINKDEFDLEFILFNSKNSDLFNYISKNEFKCKNYTLSSKFFIPFYIFFFFFKLLFKRYDFIHCHLFEASIIGIIAGKFAGIKKRIYTRHHADFHHVYFPQAVKYDLLINKHATHIIAVSNNIQQILINLENVPVNKISVIPHGIPKAILNKNISFQEIEAIKSKYQITNHSPIIGVVSRFTEWKGIQYIIPAFKNLLNDYPNSKLVLANARGDYENKIMNLLIELPKNAYILIPFEQNMSVLFKSFDVFVHTPIDETSEAFGQVYIEALGLKVPMVCTLSGIATDFIINKTNAIVVKHKNSNEILEAIQLLLNNHGLKEKIISRGFIDVQNFTFEQKFEKLKQLYSN